MRRVEEKLPYWVKGKVQEKLVPDHHISQTPYEKTPATPHPSPNHPPLHTSAENNPHCT